MISVATPWRQRWEAPAAVVAGLAPAGVEAQVDRALQAANNNLEFRDFPAAQDHQDFKVSPEDLARRDLEVLLAIPARPSEFRRSPVKAETQIPLEASEGSDSPVVTTKAILSQTAAKYWRRS